MCGGVYEYMFMAVFDMEECYVLLLLLVLNIVHCTDFDEEQYTIFSRLVLTGRFKLLASYYY